MQVTAETISRSVIAVPPLARNEDLELKSGRESGDRGLHPGRRRQDIAVWRQRQFLSHPAERIRATA